MNEIARIAAINRELRPDMMLYVQRRTNGSGDEEGGRVVLVTTGGAGVGDNDDAKVWDKGCASVDESGSSGLLGDETGVSGLRRNKVSKGGVSGEPADVLLDEVSGVRSQLEGNSVMTG
jgi:hypothetical protein